LTDNDSVKLTDNDSAKLTSEAGNSSNWTSSSPPPSSRDFSVWDRADNLCKMKIIRIHHEYPCRIGRLNISGEIFIIPNGLTHDGLFFSHFKLSLMHRIENFKKLKIIKIHI
jgi:hypothetical protein